MKNSLLLLSVFLMCACFSQRVSEDSRLSGRVADAMSGMVVSENKAASEIGRAVLKQGGNAFDAAVAVSFALSVIRPHSTGIGGGGFVLSYHADDRATRFLDMRERAPAAATRDMYKSVPGGSRAGGLAVGIPGTVAGLHELYERFGSKKISWNALVEPAASLAAGGFPVYPHLEVAIQWAKKEGLYDSYPALEEVLLSSNGDLLKRGETLRQPALAETLRAIAKHGPKAFYTGEIADNLLEAVRESGGILTKDDLRSYEVKWRNPLRSKIGHYEIVSSPPPSSGGTAIIQMLQFLEELQDEEVEFHSSKDLISKISAMKLAFEDRAKFLGDPDFSVVPAQRLISENHIKERLASLRAYSAPTLREEESNDDLLPTSTTHYCVVDAQGNVVSSTESINYFFGSAVFDPKTGVILNNTMDDFAADPDRPNLYGLVQGEANAIAPGKTPLSSMSPTIVLKDHRPTLALGSPGGPKIITGVLQVLHGVLAHHLPLEEAIRAPRIHNQWQPDITSYEDGECGSLFNQSVSQTSGKFRKNQYGIGNVSALRLLPSGRKLGVSDPRREGWAAGY